MDTVVFTPASLLEVLSMIDELNEFELGLTETLDGNYQLQIGDSTYIIETNDTATIDVEEGVVSEVENINQDAYDELEDSGVIETLEPIESGLLKEAVKSLLLGGAIKLAAKML